MAAPGPVGVVTGLASEVRVARSVAAELHDHIPQPLMACAGASPRRAYRKARALVDQGATALVSFGIAGGLHPALHVGTLVIGAEVFTPEHHLLPGSPSWRGALEKAANETRLKIETGRIAGSNRVVVHTGAKAALHSLSGAIAVDMESHAVAAVAWEKNIPFRALRAIIDDAESHLPSIVRGSINRHGKPRKTLMALRLAASPWNYGALKKLERDSRTAHQALGGLSPIASTLFGGAV
jgi:hopanoid-associated phosphorylase